MVQVCPMKLCVERTSTIDALLLPISGFCITVHSYSFVADQFPRCLIRLIIVELQMCPLAANSICAPDYAPFLEFWNSMRRGEHQTLRF